jgi:acyl-CoA synthetase (AMP-forming)/AMP-acid ligase II/acyl carrier protein
LPNNPATAPSLSPQILNIYSLIETQAGKIPDHIAIMATGKKSITYSVLRNQVNNVVEVLRASGLGRNDRIALVLPNGPDMAVAFIAVSACAISAPLNLGYRADEFDFYLTDLNVKALIVQVGSDSAAIAVARTRGIAVIELTPSLTEAGVFTLSGGTLDRESDRTFPQTGDIALLLHTSGTTSRPKLVPLSQSNLCASAFNVAQTLALTHSDRCLNVMPLFHIHGLIGALLSSLASGGSVICASDFSAPQFFTWIEECNPSWYSAVPTMHQAILARAPENLEIIARHPLRLIRSSSAALPLPVMAELEAAFKAPVIESYGMTEAAHQMASNPLPPAARKPGSVGIAAGPQVAIMDATGNLLSQGQTGEVVIRGVSVTSGYVNNDEANRGAFSLGWFRTGDQGYIDADGYLFLTGRLKEIINRGGEKISPREIDDVLMTHPAIAQAVAFAVPHVQLGEDVAAAVVLKEGVNVSEREIREFLFDRIADFKVPSQVVIVDKIPKGPTGKLQRIGLAEKLIRQLSKEHIAPRNEIERIVAEIFAEVLKIKNFGVEDNFFALGGDSLTGTQVASRMQAIFDIELPNVLVFRRPTVAELAEEIAVSMEGTDKLSMEILLEMENLSAEEIQKLFADTD